MFHPLWMSLSSRCFSHSRPAKGCPYRLTRSGTAGSSRPFSCYQLGHLPLGIRIQTTGHLLRGSLSKRAMSACLTCAYAETQSAAEPATPGILATTSSDFTATIWEAPAPCSAKTAWNPSLSLMSPQRKPALICLKMLL